MNIELKKEIENLRKYSKMESQEDIKMFEIKSYDLAKTKDPEVLRELIDIFDDDCLYEEVMFSLLHAIETYPDDVYIEGVLLKVKDFDKYLEWFTTIIYRILNHDDSRNLLMKKINVADQNKLLELLNIIESESKEHYSIIQNIKQEMALNK